MMKYSKNRIKAILIKDSQDIWKSTNIVYMYLLPIVLTILWSRFIPDMPASFALSFGLMFLVIMVGMYVPSMIIAEEKEKKTIEILLLSPAKPLEVFIGKGLITLISILITAVILLIISGNLQTQIYLILIATTLISTFSIFLGMIVGLLAENQMSTGVIGLPVYLILLLVPQFSMMGIRIMEDIGRFLPTYYYLDLLNIVTEGKEIRLISHFGVLLSSILVAFILLYYVYRKKGFE
jgi:ABC-2 type transport system permease protein